MTYETHESPDVLMAELVEATQALTQYESTLNRAETELRNAQAQYDAARGTVEDLTGRREVALEASRPAPTKAAAAPVPKVPVAAPETPTADDLAI